MPAQQLQVMQEVERYLSLLPNPPSELITRLHFAIIDEQEFFVITRICRDDLESIDFDASNVDDDTMYDIAQDMGESYVSYDSFWDDLKSIADKYDVPHHESEEDEDCECCDTEGGFAPDQDGGCCKCRHDKEAHYNEGEIE